MNLTAIRKVNNMAKRQPIEALAEFLTKPNKAKVEVWDTRFGTSPRLVKRSANGRFADDVSLKQINSI